MSKRALSVFDKHALKIARDTLRMPDAMLGVMGGPSKEEAAETVYRLTGKRPAIEYDRPVRAERGPSLEEVLASQRRSPWVEERSGFGPEVHEGHLRGEHSIFAQDPTRPSLPPGTKRG